LVLHKALVTTNSEYTYGKALSWLKQTRVVMLIMSLH